MTLLTEQQIITMYILSNIPRSKGNQKIKSGVLIEYKKRNVLLEKSCIKCNGEAASRRFYQKSKCPN